VSVYTYTRRRVAPRKTAFRAFPSTFPRQFFRNSYLHITLDVCATIAQAEVERLEAHLARSARSVRCWIGDDRLLAPLLLSFFGSHSNLCARLIHANGLTCPILRFLSISSFSLFYLYLPALFISGRTVQRREEERDEALEVVRWVHVWMCVY
jgi:hypothetical protein